MDKKSVLTTMVLVGVLSLLVVGSAKGAVITVRADGSGDYPTIQAAIDAAAAGDEVVLEPGTYTGDGNRDIDYNGKAITVRSVEPNDPDIVNTTIIDCQGSFSSPHRGFHFHSGEDANSVLAGLTITNGYAPIESSNTWPSNYARGGGILCFGSSPVITRCRIEGNRVRIEGWYGDVYGYGSGGGIHCRGGSNATISHCIITGNSAYGGDGGPGVGGGISAYGCTITDCIISDNQAGSTGLGIEAGGGTIENCLITNNSSSAYYSQDGAIVAGDGTKIINCTITQNDKGGILCWFEDVYIDDCEISENTSFGIKSIYGGTAHVSNCRISKNPDTGVKCGDGGIKLTDSQISQSAFGIWCENELESYLISVERCKIFKNGCAVYASEVEELEIKNSIISENYSGLEGVICCLSSDMTIRNCTIADNVSIYWDYGCVYVDAYSSAVLANCIIRENRPRQIRDKGTTEVRYCNIEGDWAGEGNIDLEPFFVAGGDYYLTPVSPCIDSGDPNYTAEPNETDMEGNERILDGDGDSNSIVDMGAHEYNPDVSLIGISEPEFEFYCAQGWEKPEAQILEILNCGSGTLSWEIIEDCGWLEVVPGNGVSEGEIDEVEILVDANGLVPGVYSYTFEVSDPNALNNPAAIDVTMVVGSVLEVSAGNYPTIQSAIDAAEEHDVVVVSDGVYRGEGNRDLDFGGKAIIVCSENGAENCIIDCNGSEAEPHRGFYFHNFEDERSVVDGLTIINGYASRGGGVICYNSSPRITNCRIIGNSSYIEGGGIACNASSSPISNCVISGNASVGNGGGICYFGGLTISDCVIKGNSAGGNGGGIYTESYEMVTTTITNCVIQGNTADNGGGLCSSGSWYKTIVVVEGCTVSGNTAASTVGGIWCYGNSIITGCLISDNSAEHVGGLGFEGEAAKVTNCRIIDNSSTEGTGGVWCKGREVSVKNCEITGNSGGGVYEYGGGIVFGHSEYLTVSNCTIADNSAEVGVGGLLCNEFHEGYFEISNCIIWGNSPEQVSEEVELTYCAVEGGWAGEGNIDSGPRFALAGDYHLSADSPCINAGDPNYMAFPGESDIDGNPRIIGGVVDMGAYEYNGSSATIAASPSEFSFYYAQGWVRPEAQSLQIRNCGGGSLNWEIVEDCDWLEVVPGSGVSSGEIDTVTLSMEPNALEPGLYHYRFEVRDSNAVNSPVGVDVWLRVGALLGVGTDFDTIQAAIDAAVDYDTVVVADGVYMGYGNRDLDFKGKAITVRSENGPENCIIDCNGTEEEPHRGFYFHSGEDERSVLEGLTITNAWGNGAIYYNDYSSWPIMPGPVISGCIITGNHDSGISIIEGDIMTIKGCTISNNGRFGIYSRRELVVSDCDISSNNESGIVSDSSLTVTGCTIRDNSNRSARNFGGGINSSYSGDLEVSDCTITGNYAARHGGGIYREGYGRMNISNCVISNNLSEGFEGGGIYIRDADDFDINITDCIITKNRCLSARRWAAGGGISCNGPHDRNLNISNCVISDNVVRASSESLGGGIYNYSSKNLNLVNCTISGNRAESGNLSEGGGVYCWRYEGVTVSNCILWGNEAADGPQMYCLGSEGNIAYIGYTDLQGGEEGVYIDPNVSVEWGFGNIDADPCFALAGDWHLLEGSACIEGGDPDYASEPNETDIDGNGRVLDGDGDGDSVIDMGAYEYNMSAASIAASPKEFSFYYAQDWVKPEPQVLQIRNCGGGALNWEIVEDCEWLEIAPASGVSEGEIDEVEITVEPNLLDVGLYYYRFEVRDANAVNNPVKVDVYLRVGAVHYVPSVDCATIQCAIDAAEDYDTVLVADGVYTGYGNRDLDYRGKAIVVCSENGPENCIIDCDGTEEEPNRGFYFHNRENEDSVLDGFTITNGWATPGGGIFCEESSPTIRNCVIKSCYSRYGGGVYCYEGSPVISNCTISGNRAGEEGRGWGGGIGCEYGSNAKIINCVVTGNTTGDTGGGIYCVGVAMISGCSITGNTADRGMGGGLWAPGYATVVNCEITNNSARWIGGIWCGGVKSRIENCIISGNSASDAIGGVFFGNSNHNKNHVMTNCLIAGNKSLGYGTGGVACMGGTISNCTIVGNFALNLSGGATCEQGDVDILNSIMWGNESPDGSEIYLRNEGVVFVSHSDVEGGEGSVYVEPNSVLEWGFGSIDVEPGFVEAGYWDANGTPGDVNDDLWIDGDYHLLEGSACIDAGDPNYIPELGETDLDGNERVVNRRIDMGAYEAGLPPVEVEVKLTPRMLNCASKGKWVKAHVILPEGYWPEDIDVNTPAVAEPMGAESVYIEVFDNGNGKFAIEIGFDREAFCAAGLESEDGFLDVTVTGWLLTGERFEGTDTIKVISQRWRHREHKREREAVKK